MQFREYPPYVFNAYVIHRTTGTGDQGGTPIQVHEMVAQCATEEEALAMIDRLNKLSGRTSSWCDWGYTYNINTNTEVGKAELKKFEEQVAVLKQDQLDHPNDWGCVELESGHKIHYRKNPEWDKAWNNWSKDKPIATATFQILNLGDDSSKV